MPWHYVTVSPLLSPDGTGNLTPRALTERSVKVSLRSSRPIYRLSWNSVIQAQ